LAFAGAGAVALDADAVALGAAGAVMVLFTAGFARSADRFFGVSCGNSEVDCTSRRF
jgi:hypothetical protein